MLGKVLNKFNNGKNFYESMVATFVEDTRLTNQLMPSDKLLKDEFAKSNLYSRDATSFLLKKIENNDSRIPYSKLNIEHIMPQTSTTDWLECINIGSEYEDVVNRIGNLTLVDSVDNSTMKNKNFNTKKEILNKSKHIKMNTYILEKNSWNEDEINTRSEIIADYAIKLFPYPALNLINDNCNIQFNLNSDKIYSADNYVNTKPVELIVNDEIVSNISKWSDVLNYTLTLLYNRNPSLFVNAAKKIHEDFLYQSEQISNKKDDMRTPYEFAEGMYVEENTNTYHKLTLMQRLLEYMNTGLKIDIIYSSKNNNTV